MRETGHWELGFSSPSAGATGTVPAYASRGVHLGVANRATLRDLASHPAQRDRIAGSGRAAKK